MLSDDDRAMLDLESKWWRYASSKENAARDRLGLSATRYAQRLLVLIDDPEAAVHAPITVNRLRARRDARHRGYRTA